MEIDACVRGYHYYKEIWIATEGKVLACSIDVGNTSDRYAVAVKKDSDIVGHVPRILSSAYNLFLRKGGTISCIITGCRRYSWHLPQGGLEVPCKLIFQSEENDIISKVKRLISQVSLPSTWSAKPQGGEPPSKKQRTEENYADSTRETTVWISRKQSHLSMADRAQPFLRHIFQTSISNMPADFKRPIPQYSWIPVYFAFSKQTPAPLTSTVNYL